MKALAKPILGSFSAGVSFFFQWVLIHAVSLALWVVVSDDLWKAEQIVFHYPTSRWFYGGHWAFWLQDRLDDPWPMMACLLAYLTASAAFGIVLGKLQYSVLRQQGYRDSWWVPVTLIAPFVAWLGRLIAGRTLLSLWAPSWVSGAAGGLGFGVTQWVVLRRQFRRAAWWMVATTLGEALWGFRFPGLSGAVYGAVDGTIRGTLTGFTMMWLLRCPTERVARA